MHQQHVIHAVVNDELRTVRGGSIWGKIKAVAKWVKKHVVATGKSIGITGKF